MAALDIGGTKTAAALVTPTGEVLHRATTPTPGSRGPDAVLQAAADLVTSLPTRSAATTPTALGVGSAGVLDPMTGHVVGATNVLRDWTGTDLVGELQRRTGLRTVAINDVHAHGLGEAIHGAGAGHRTVLVMAVGTGIGASQVIDGIVLRGARGVAGHAGHQPSPFAAKLPCTCGGRGHLEAIASGPALAREYRRRAATDVLDLREVASRAATGADRVAADVIALGGSAVGSCLGGLVNVLDPHLVVVGGGVANLGGAWWEALVTAFRAELLPALDGVGIVPATLGDDAALVGAAHAAWELVA
ncbi:ROK family protein [Pedococcus sp. NPDC057267]|uniref:ROK family protein n=1 Tax=Pedococcus sp. NPDC057267 TaxID=3346077 RepID=UPI00362970A1